MQTVSIGDKLHKCQILFSGKDKKNINLSSAELAQRVVIVKLENAHLVTWAQVYIPQVKVDLNFEDRDLQSTFCAFT